MTSLSFSKGELSIFAVVVFKILLKKFEFIITMELIFSTFPLLFLPEGIRHFFVFYRKGNISNSLVVRGNKKSEGNRPVCHQSLPLGAGIMTNFCCLMLFYTFKTFYS